MQCREVIFTKWRQFATLPNPLLHRAVVGEDDTLSNTMGLNWRMLMSLMAGIYRYNHRILTKMHCSIMQKPYSDEEENVNVTVSLRMPWLTHDMTCLFLRHKQIEIIKLLQITPSVIKQQHLMPKPYRFLPTNSPMPYVHTSTHFILSVQSGNIGMKNFSLHIHQLHAFTIISAD